MTPELEHTLFSRYPKLFAQYILPTGPATGPAIDCYDGWFELLDSLCSTIQLEIDHNADTPQAVVRQIKEKFGTLRVRMTAPATERQQGMIDFVTSISEKICESCGSIRIRDKDIHDPRCGNPSMTGADSGR